MKRLLLAAALLTLNAAPSPAADDLMSIYKGYAADTQAALTQPHRSITELANWLSDTVADALVLSPADAAQKMNALRANFTEAGYNSYLTFLNSHGLVSGLQNKTVTLSAIVNNEPVLIGQGASSGRYAWAFEMPVTLSAKQAGKDEPLSRTVTLRIQIGRSAQAKNPNGVLIESWNEFKDSGPVAAESGGQPATTP